MMLLANTGWSLWLILQVAYLFVKSSKHTIDNVIHYNLIDMHIGLKYFPHA
jgi:hypothetical protein